MSEYPEIDDYSCDDELDLNWEQANALHQRLLKLRFTHLKNEWKEKTRYLSHGASEFPEYQAIIEMGKKDREAMLKIILTDLQAETNFWFLALKEIAGEDPIPRQDWGKVQKMRQCWLKWGKEKGYLDSFSTILRPEQ